MSRCRRHKPAHWYQPRALSAFHRLVQRIAIGNIDQVAAAVERRQGDDFLPLSLRAEQQAQRRFDQLLHGAALAHGLALKLRHDGVVDIEGRLHMVICITDMEI